MDLLSNPTFQNVFNTSQRNKGTCDKKNWAQEEQFLLGMHTPGDAAMQLLEWAHLPQGQILLHWGLRTEAEFGKD